MRAPTTISGVLDRVIDATMASASPSAIAKGNSQSHAIGLGQMNLHGYLAREQVHYGSEEGIDFTNMYFYTVTFHAITESNKIAMERGETFEGFRDSTYADGTYFDSFDPADFAPKTEKVKGLFEKSTAHIPSAEDWAQLKADVMAHGLYNRNLQAVPPTGSIFYIYKSTS